MTRGLYQTRQAIPKAWKRIAAVSPLLVVWCVKGSKPLEKTCSRLMRGIARLRDSIRTRCCKQRISLIIAEPKAMLFRTAFCCVPIFTCYLIAICWVLTLLRCVWKQVHGFRTDHTQILMVRRCFCLKRRRCARTRISLSRSTSVLSVAFDSEVVPWRFS